MYHMFVEFKWLSVPLHFVWSFCFDKKGPGDIVYYIWYPCNMTYTCTTSQNLL